MFMHKHILWGAVLLLIIPTVTFSEENSTPGYMDNFKKVITDPAILVEFLLNAKLSDNLETATQRIPESLCEAGFDVSEKKVGPDVRLGGKIVPSKSHTFWKHYESPDQRPWIDIIEFENEEDCGAFFQKKDQWHSGSPSSRSFLFFTVNNQKGLDAVSVILKRGRTILNFGFDIPFKILMPKEGDNSPEERKYISDSIDSLVASMGAIAKALADPDTITWIPPVSPNQEETRIMRLAAFSRLWSEVKYNFAFLEQRPNLDWERILELYLTRIDKAESQQEYIAILQEAVALLEDGHSSVRGGDSQDSPLLNIEPVEGKPVVTAVGSTPEMKASAIRLGMELIAVNGVEVKQLLEKEIYPFIFASTPQDRDRKAFRHLLAGESGTSISATFRDMDNTQHEVTLVCNLNENREAAPWTKRPLPFVYKEPAEGIAYVALNTFGNSRVVKAFDAKYEKILEAEGLIIDVRNNGGGNTTHGYSIISRLIDEPNDKTSIWRSRKHIPVFKAWGRKQEWHEGNHGTIEPRGDTPFSKPVVVLIGPNTYSAAEDFLVPLKASGRATLIGEPTGGSTGQPLIFNVYGTRVAICVKWDRFPDGTDFVGVGVQPDIEIPLTKQDVRDGTDPVLEKAISFLKNKKP